MSFHRCLAGFLAAGLPLVVSGAGDDHRGHGAHVHGVARLNVAVEGDGLVAELTSPAMSIVGFEHAPRDDDEREAIHRAVRMLEDAGNLLILPEAAACRVESVRVESALVEQGDDDRAGRDEHDHEEEHEAEQGESGHDHDEHEGGHDETHSEFQARYVFHCDTPGDVSGFEVALFEAFPGIEKIELQALTASGQTGGELTRGDNAIRLRD